MWNKKAAPSRHRASVFFYLLAPMNLLLGVNQILRDRAEWPKSNIQITSGEGQVIAMGFAEPPHVLV